MAGLDPAIHVLLFQPRRKKGVDARVMPGHDGELFAEPLSARLLKNRETLDAL